MKTIVISSDSFKGTLSSLQICELFKNEIKDRDIKGIYVPIADGGEGSLEAISNILEGHFVEVKVKNLYFKEISTKFYVDINNNAYIETASCAGLTLADENNDPGYTTTYGLGEQIKEAIKLGIKNIYVFLGGSATNDGGAGLATALGTKFFDETGNIYTPTGINLNEISYIDNEETDKLLKNINIYALVDVKSPLFGKEGAAYKFAKQKGASEEEIEVLDQNLIYLSKMIRNELDIKVDNVPGAGAAGGLGAGLYAFARAKISSGINTILDLIDFENIISDADLVISGEGKLDKQTFDGKVIDGVSKRCLAKNKPLDLIVGITESSLEEVKANYPSVRNIYETNEEHLPFEQVKKYAKESYIKQIKKLLNNL